MNDGCLKRYVFAERERVVVNMYEIGAIDGPRHAYLVTATMHTANSQVKNYELCSNGTHFPLVGSSHRFVILSCSMHALLCDRCGSVERRNSRRRVVCTHIWVTQYVGNDVSWKIWDASSHWSPNGILCTNFEWKFIDFFFGLSFWSQIDGLPFYLFRGHGGGCWRRVTVVGVIMGRENEPIKLHMFEKFRLNNWFESIAFRKYCFFGIDNGGATTCYNERRNFPVTYRKIWVLRIHNTSTSHRKIERNPKEKSCDTDWAETNTRNKSRSFSVSSQW